MTYTEMKQAVIKALANKDEEELKHLQWLDGRWYEDIMEVFRKNNISCCHWGWKNDFPCVDEKTLEPNAIAPIIAK